MLRNIFNIFKKVGNTVEKVNELIILVYRCRECVACQLST